MPQEENYQPIRETEKSMRDAGRELERLRRQLAWQIQLRPKPDDGQLSLAIDRLSSNSNHSAKSANCRNLTSVQRSQANWAEVFGAQR